MKKYENYTREELITELNKLSKRKKYGLVWEEERTQEKFELDTEGKLPVLIEDKKKELKTDNEKPVNILIEGDNYHALSVLNYTHPKSIDVIYIDPPYNTGNNDFKYNDKFVDKEDTYRHSKWLSFMSKRLRLAKKLLKDSGIIFISIDDNEMAPLKMLCDEIFGEKNFISQLKWKKKKQPSFLHNQVAGIMEYITVYAKNISCANKLSIEKIDGDTKPLFNASNKISEKSFPAGIRVKYKDGIIKKGKHKAKTVEIEYLNDVIVKNNRTKNPFVLRAKFRDGQPNISMYAQMDLIFISSNNTLRREISQEESEKAKPIIDLLLDWGQNQDAFDEMLEIFGKKDVFSNPKPKSLIFNLVKSASQNENITVLDFFAGSGTTGHAVLELNKEDKGNRKFILCTSNENNICTDVCYPRVQKVIQGYKNSKKETVDGLGGNLKYYKTDFVGSEPSHRNKKLLTQKSVEMICIRENTFEEELNKKDYFIFSNKEKYTALLFDEMKLAEFKKEISKLKKPVSVYVFSLDGDDYKEEFETLKNDITLCAVPEAILKVYRRIHVAGQLKFKLQ